MIECSIKNCKKEGRYAIYELVVYKGFCKIWRTDICATGQYGLIESYSKINQHQRGRLWR